MSDLERQQLIRQARESGGSVEAEAKILADRVRSGEFPRERVVLASKLGDPVAGKVMPQRFISDYRAHLRSLFEHGENTMYRTLIAGLHVMQEHLDYDMNDEQKAAVGRIIDLFEEWFILSSDEDDQVDIYDDQIRNEVYIVSGYDVNNQDPDYDPYLSDMNAIEEGRDPSSPQAEFAHNLENQLHFSMTNHQPQSQIVDLIHSFLADKIIDEDDLDGAFRERVLPWVLEGTDQLRERVYQRRGLDIEDNQ